MAPVDPNDYRIAGGWNDWTRGFVFQWQRWRALSPTWDHDHCIFCGREFSGEPHESGDGKLSLTEGYAAPGPLSASKDRQRKDYHWVCPTCFGDLKDYFGWTVAEPDPSV